MPFNSKVVLSGALLAAIVVPANVSAQSVRERVGAAIETVQAACADDIAKFCGNVSRGEGRLLACMQAYDDQLSRRCGFAVYRASRKLDRALDRVERIADACWDDIEAKCGDADSVGRCLIERRGEMSQSCQTVVSGIRRALQGLASLRGMNVFTADDKELGKVVEVVNGPDGEMQSIQVQIAPSVGLGDRVVTVDADTVEQLADRIRLRLAGDAIRSLPVSGR
jgi:hypothetical protein